MAIPFWIAHGPFSGGLNNRVESYLLKAHEAQTAQNVALHTGAIEGLNDCGASVASGVSAGARFLHYGGGSAWLSSADQQWALNDGNLTYYTRVGKLPRIKTPSVEYDLGILPPGGFAFNFSNTGGSIGAGTYKWAFTFCTDDGRESNPQGFDFYYTFPSGTTNGRLLMASIPVSGDPRVTKRKIWRTEADGSIFYLAWVIENNDPSYDNMTGDASYVFQDTKSDVELLRGDFVYMINGAVPQLRWTPGGAPQQPWEASKQYIEDHSQAPILDVLANAMHSVMGEVGASGSDRKSVV